MKPVVLSDVDIQNGTSKPARLKVDPPLPPSQRGSCSVDFRLGNEFSIFEHSRHPFIDRPRNKLHLSRTSCVPSLSPTARRSFSNPGSLRSRSHSNRSNWTDEDRGRLEGRSSLGRIGIIVHGTAGLFDPGWRGKATLELSNLGIMPVALYPGMRICSFTFEQLSSPTSVPYYKKKGNKYAGQTSPLASKLAGELK